MSLIVTATDFGLQGPYAGEVRAVLATQAPGVTVVDLMHDLPRFDPHASAYLLAMLCERYPAGTVILGVVDPGVGTDARWPIWLEADGRYFVGPDNGLFRVAACRSRSCRWHRIQWRPRGVAVSFHGRDLFAPVAARLATGRRVQSQRLRRRTSWTRRWPQELDEVVYVDGFGNAVLGRRARSLSRKAQIRIGTRTLRYAKVFAEVAPGQAFWYRNSMGLVEVAVNRASARDVLGLAIGSPVQVVLDADA